MKNHRKQLWASPDQHLVIKGLNSKSIREPAVPVFLNEQPVGKIQAIEFYENSPCGKHRPLMSVDVIANTFIRLSYLRGDGKSGTLGSSIAGTVSFRTADGTLRYIPQVDFAKINFPSSASTEVVLAARFGEVAELTSTRRYFHDGSGRASLELIFKAKQDIHLSAGLIGIDCFRIATISSMFAGDIFDGNIIVANEQEKQEALELSDSCKRDQYLLRRGDPLTTISLLKSAGSSAKRGTPGALDSPSLSLQYSIAAKNPIELGAQAYLSQSMDVNEDSLSVWAEWRNAPNVIPSGFELRAAINAKAFSTALSKF